MKKQGQLFKLGLVDGTGAFHVIAYAQKDTLDCKTDIDEISSPKSGTSKTHVAGLTSWEFSHEGFWGSTDKIFAFEGEYYTSDQLLFLLWQQRSSVQLRYVEEDGWLLAEGTALIERISTGSQVNNMVKMSVKLKGSGELRLTNVANQSGHFAAAFKNSTLTLYAAEAPLSNCTIAYNGTDLGAWTVGSATVQFPLSGTFDAALLTAHNADGPLDRITFEDATRLHLVLVTGSETEAATGQQVHTVRPYWWNTWNLGNVVIHYAGGASQTLSTQYIQDRGEKVTLAQSPANITSVELDGPQLLDCCDITESLTRTLTLRQTTMNGAYGGDVVLSEPLACDITVALYDTSGNIQASALMEAGETAVTLSYPERVLSAGQLYFQFTDRATGVAAPYSFALGMEEDLTSHAMLYAYSASKHMMTVCCPDQSWPVRILAGGSVVFNGLAATPQTFPCTTVTGLTTDRGSYTFRDVTNVDCWLIGSGFFLTATNLFPIYPTMQGVRTGQEIPVLQEPDSGITMSKVADGAEMDSDAVQTLTFRGAISGKKYYVACAQKDNGNGTYDVTVRLLTQSGVTARLPVSVFVQYGSSLPLQIEIPAQSPAATKTMSASQLWVTPTANVSSSFSHADVISVECYETCDITPSHYYYYPVCTLSGYSYADIGYHSTSHGTIRFNTSNFPVAADYDEQAEIPPLFSIANHMARYSGSSTTPTITVMSGPSGWNVTPQLAPDPSLLLMYYDGGEANIAVVNQHPHITSRFSAIGDILPYMRVRLVRSSYAQAKVYNAVGLYAHGNQDKGGLRPGDSATRPTGEVKIYTGNTTVPSTESQGVLEFSKTPEGEAISATCLSSYVYVKRTDDGDFYRQDQ